MADPDFDPHQPLRVCMVWAVTKDVTPAVDFPACGSIEEVEDAMRERAPKIYADEAAEGRRPGVECVGHAPTAVEWYVNTCVWREDGLPYYSVSGPFPEAEARARAVEGGGLAYQVPTPPTR